VCEGKGILDPLRASFARLNERLDHVDIRLDGLRSRIGSPERHVASSTLRIASLKVNFSATQSRLDWSAATNSHLRRASGVDRSGGMRAEARQKLYWDMFSCHARRRPRSISPRHDHWYGIVATRKFWTSRKMGPGLRRQDV
jgi:hypothetical protein